MGSKKWIGVARGSAATSKKNILDFVVSFGVMAKGIFDEKGKMIGTIESDKEAFVRWNLNKGPTWGVFGDIARDIKELGDDHPNERWYHTWLLWVSLILWPVYLWGVLRRLTTKKRYQKGKLIEKTRLPSNPWYMSPSFHLWIFFSPVWIYGLLLRSRHARMKRELGE